MPTLSLEGYTASAGTPRGKGRLRMGGQASLPRQGHLSWVLRDEKGVCPMVEADNDREAYNICYEERTQDFGQVKVPVEAMGWSEGQQCHHRIHTLGRVFL